MSICQYRYDILKNSYFFILPLNRFYISISKYRAIFYKYITKFF